MHAQKHRFVRQCSISKALSFKRASEHRFPSSIKKVSIPTVESRVERYDEHGHGDAPHRIPQADRRVQKRIGWYGSDVVFCLSLFSLFCLCLSLFLLFSLSPLHLSMPSYVYVCMSLMCLCRNVCVCLRVYVGICVRLCLCVPVSLSISLNVRL